MISKYVAERLELFSAFVDASTVDIQHRGEILDMLLMLKKNMYDYPTITTIPQANQHTNRSCKNQHPLQLQKDRGKQITKKKSKSVSKKQQKKYQLQ